jgi:hypothetical protein
MLNFTFEANFEPKKPMFYDILINYIKHVSYMTEEKTIIEKRDAAGFENAEAIKLSVLRKILLKAEVIKTQQ